MEESKKRAYEISFCVVKERKIKYIRQSLERLGVRFNEYKNRDGIKFAIYDKNICNFLHPLGGASNKYIPRFILTDMGRENLACLLEGIIASDGTDGSAGTWYYTTSKRLKDDVVELCALLGRMTHTFYRERETNFPHGKKVQGSCYEIRILKNNTLARPSKYRSKTLYSGMIYCVEVPNHVLLIRRRGTTAWCGNSHRVVTVNLPKAAVQAEKDKKAFFYILDKRLEAAKKLLIVHRAYLLKERIENGNGFLKFFEPLKWFSLDHFFSTIGITGIFEMCYFMGLDIRSEEGTQFVLEVLSHIEKRLDEFTNETGYNFNCEEIPGESAAVTLAKKDCLTFGRDVQPFALYSNQYIPVIAEATMLERIKLTGKFMSLLSGGGILHLNISDKIQNKYQMRKLIEVALKNGVEHFAVNYGFAVCQEGHVSIAGNSTTCPICGSPIDDYLTRIIGYFTKVSSWNPVRRDVDFPNRKFAALDVVDDIQVGVAYEY